MFDANEVWHNQCQVSVARPAVCKAIAVCDKALNDSLALKPSNNALVSCI